MFMHSAKCVVLLVVLVDFNIQLGEIISVCASVLFNNTDNRDYFGHYNRDMTFSYRFILNISNVFL